MADREYTRGSLSKWFKPMDIHGRHGLFELPHGVDWVYIYMPPTAEVGNGLRLPYYTLDEAENAALALLAMIRDHRNEV